MQELREAIRGSSQQDEELPVREFYEHPWYKYKREELIASGNYQQPERTKQPLLSKQDMEFQEERKKRKVKKLDFEIR